nr:8008_t:CDS:2 [Entrophospora candida]
MEDSPLHSALKWKNYDLVNVYGNFHFHCNLHGRTTTGDPIFLHNPLLASLTLSQSPFYLMMNELNTDVELLPTSILNLKILKILYARNSISGDGGRISGGCSDGDLMAIFQGIKKGVKISEIKEV